MLYMVVERFKLGAASKIYRRARAGVVACFPRDSSTLTAGWTWNSPAVSS